MTEAAFRRRGLGGIVPGPAAILPMAARNVWNFTPA
jgi:hypothetical protein